jgi:exodeoxyribonuclease VII large subunit
MIRHRPVLADPIAGIESRSEEITRLVDAGRRDVLRELAKQDTLVEHLRARLQTLGPAATLARGYAVVQRMVTGSDPEVLRSVDDAPPGTQIRVRVADGAVTAAVMGKVR